MEKLITCSTVLYDKDISDKMEEITSLKRNIRFYEKPKIEYSNVEEWDTKIKEAYQIIKNGLNTWIIENTFEYQCMYYDGLTSRQKIFIRDHIQDALNIITKENNKEWVEKISYDIVYGIDGFFNGFIKTGNWVLIYLTQLDPETMANLIYNNIIWQLDDGEHAPCILNGIPIFTCKMCGKKGDFADINDTNICFDCEETEESD